MELQSLEHLCHRPELLARRRPGHRSGGIRQDQHPSGNRTTEPSLFGATVNPWAPGITPGGSVGSAARWPPACARGLGGGGTGSIQCPQPAADWWASSRAGRGRRSAPGGHALEGLAVEHALTRTVRDSAALLDAVTGSDPGDPCSAPLPAEPFSTAITRTPAPQRILLAADSPFRGPGTDPRGARRGGGDRENTAEPRASRRHQVHSTPTPSPTRSRCCR